jgi:hypothetical protein
VSVGLCEDKRLDTRGFASAQFPQATSQGKIEKASMDALEDLKLGKTPKNALRQSIFILL